MNAHDAATYKAIQAMINEFGQLRLLVAIDSMPEKLQRARQLLRELDAEYELKAKQSKLMQAEEKKRQAIADYYIDRANGSHAALAK